MQTNQTGEKILLTVKNRFRFDLHLFSRFRSEQFFLDSGIIHDFVFARRRIR